MLECDGVRLHALLRRSGILTAPARGAELARHLLVTARDGYRVVYSLAELDPATQPHAGNAILADRCNGKPLNADDGPLRLLFPGDHRPARWVRQLQSITVIDPS